MEEGGDEDAPAVLVCHGFKGFRRWGFFPWVGERLAEAGWTSAVMDFSRNGIGEDPLEFDRLDLFRSNTYSRELADLDQVIEELRARLDWTGPIGLLGHSRAAVDVVVRAAEDPRVGAVVTWNGVSRLLRFTDRQLAEWEREGCLEFTNARTGQRMAMDYGFVRDALENAERFDLGRARRVRRRHGDGRIVAAPFGPVGAQVQEFDQSAADGKDGFTRLPFVVQAGARSIDEVVDGAQGPVERGIRQAGKQHHIADVAVPAVGAPDPFGIGAVGVLCFSPHKNHFDRIRTTKQQNDTSQ
mgnify:CR=1 FL=1